MGLDITLLKPVDLEDEVEALTNDGDVQYTAWARAQVQEPWMASRPDIPQKVVMAQIYDLIDQAEARHRPQAAA